VQLSHSGLQSKLLRVKKNSSFLRKLEPMESTTMVSNNVFLILMKKISHHIAFSEILSLYWHKVKEDLPGVKDTTSLWLTGRVGKVSGVRRGRGARSRFINMPLGIKEQAKTARYIAEYIELEDADKYSGHSFRRTSASHMSAAGANAETLRRKVNFHNFP
jgi:hypothetical protein